MPEQESKVTPVEHAELLIDVVTRQLLVARGRDNYVLFRQFDSWLVENQAKLGIGSDNYVALVQIHDDSLKRSNSNRKVLGIHEEVRRRSMLVIDGQETEFIEASPHVRNIWVGESVKLLTYDQASVRPHSDYSATYYATKGLLGSKRPEMIVLARNGLYYAATKNDEVINTPI